MDEGPMSPKRAPLAKAETIVSSIKSAPARTRALLELALALDRTQRPKQAAHRWSKAIATAHMITHPFQRTCTLGELALALEQVQRQEQADAVWQQAERAAFAPQHPHTRDAARYHPARALGQAHRWEQAERVISSFGQDDLRDREWLKLAVAITQAQ